MRFFLTTIFIFVLLLSCGRRNAVPKEFIQPDEMGRILWDMSLAEDLVENMHRRDTGADKKTKTLIEYQKVFGLHKVTEKQFRNSYDYYKSHPDIFKVMLDSVHARSERRRAEFFKMRT